MSVARSKRHPVTLALRAFVVGAALSVVAALGTQQWLRLSTMQRIEDEAANVEAKLNARFAGYVSLLRGTAGLFAASSWVTRDQFRRYVHQLEVQHNYPGLQGIGFSWRFPAARLPEAVATAQREGWRDFHVWPADERAEYHGILYLEPEDARNLAAIGYDMHTEPVRRAAMDRARDSGHPAISGKVTLVQEIDAAKQPGFLIYVPFYIGATSPETSEERQRQLVGFVYAPFRAGDFISTLVDSNRRLDVGVAIYDGPDATPGSLLFTREAANLAPGGSHLGRVRQLRVADRSWTLVYIAPIRGLVSPWAVLLAGLGLSAAVAVLLRGADRARRRAEQSEAMTREREGELALLIDAVPALVAYIDRAGRVRLCNRRYQEWLAIEPSEVVGRPLAEIAGPELYRAIEPHVRRALSGEGVSFERWYQLPGGGGARYLATLYVPHRPQAGNVAGFYALTSDLTAHKRAEEAARFIADCGKLLIESMDFEASTRGVVHLAVPRVADVAVLFRTDGDALAATAVAHIDGAVENRLSEFLRTVRLPLTATHNIGLAARTGMVVVSTEVNEADLDRAASDAAQRAMLRALQLRSALHVPVTVRGRTWAVFSFGASIGSGRQFTDEHRQLAEEISTRVRLAVENALLYREAQQEIEERRRAERLTRETEERFRLLVEGVRDYAIMALDPDGKIESWNEGAQRILGFAEAEAIGMPLGRLFSEEDQAAGLPESELANARERGAASDERWHVRKDGSRFWASSHTAVLHDEDGRLRGYARIMRDLTDRKRMEEELERRVQARTLELNEAVQELEAFSYSVSHDLRAPLRSIRSFTELALEEAASRLTEDERGYLARVQRAAARLDRLISDLLAYTRVSKTQVELRPVALDALVSDIQREHPDFQPPQANVRIEHPLLPVVGNEAYLTQCVTNLLGNAVKFVREGEMAEVRIWTEKIDRRVRLYVCDHGIGIAPERLSRAFEMFERLHTGGRFEGTGVGLAIVRRAVQRMKGSVGVTSTLGEGTTFWLELPAAE